LTTQEMYNIAREKPWWKNVARKVDWWDTDQGQIDVAGREQRRTWMQLARTERDEKYRIGSLRLKSKKVHINDGIKTLQHYMDTEMLWVHPRCRFFNLEMKRYHYPPAPIAKLDTQDPRKADKPVDEWNHLVKALWYFLVRKFGCYGRTGKSNVTTRREYRRMKRREREAIANV